VTDGQTGSPGQACGIINLLVPFFLAGGAITGWRLGRTYGIGLGIVGSVVGAVLGIPVVGLALAAFACIVAGVDRLTSRRSAAQKNRVGIHWATEQCRDLLDHQVRGIHFYTLNKSDATRQIYKNLGVTDSRGLQ
jgi:Methylenetetrahydrofolate reductase